MSRDRKFIVHCGGGAPDIRYVGKNERSRKFIEEARATPGKSVLDVTREEMDDMLENIQVAIKEGDELPKVVLIPQDQREEIMAHHEAGNGKAKKANGKQGGHGSSVPPAPDGA